MISVGSTVGVEAGGGCFSFNTAASFVVMASTAFTRALPERIWGVRVT